MCVCADGFFSFNEIPSDFMRKCASHGAGAMDLSLREAVSNTFVWVHEGNTALEAMRILCDTRFRHLPVCDPQWKEMLGIISIDDVVKLIASERRRAVDFYKCVPSLSFFFSHEISAD